MRGEETRAREASLLSPLGWPCTTPLAAGTLGNCSFECQIVGLTLPLWWANLMSWPNDQSADRRIHHTQAGR